MGSVDTFVSNCYMNRYWRSPWVSSAQTTAHLARLCLAGRHPSLNLKLFYTTTYGAKAEVGTVLAI